ncbi:MAG TPA: hypothetical protein VIL49_00110, partial [Capillimicrobium sp.]
RTNGSISLENSAMICGGVTWGNEATDALITRNNGTVCPGHERIGYDKAKPDDQQVTVPDIELPVPVLPATNDNAGICRPGTCPTGGTVLWNPTARTLSMNNNPTITVSGNVFVLCRLTMDNSSKLYLDPTDRTKPVRIYFDSPERCGGQTNPVDFDNNITIATTVTDGPPIQFYALGSPVTATSLTFSNNNVGRTIQIYAPQSTVKVDNHGTFTGGIAAKQVLLENNVDVHAPSSPTRLELGTGVEFERGPFTECTSSATAGQSLSQGC